jgi:hypothetical protein
MHLTKFRFIWPSGFRGEDFLEINQSETRIVCGGHFCQRIGTKWAIVQRTFHICFLPSFGSVGQTVSEEKNLKNQPIRNKNHLWWPCLLTDRDETSILYRGPSLDASYQVSDHLAKRFQRRRFLEIDQSETRIACGGHVCQWIETKWALFIEDRP